MTTPWGDVPNIPRGKGQYGIRKSMAPIPGQTFGRGQGPGPQVGPLRPSDVKYAIYGGLQLQRVLLAGWQLQPSIGIVAKDVDRLGLQFQDFSEPITEAIMYMQESIRKNFEEEGRPDRWAPLHEYTVKVRGGNAHPILRRSGRLEEAATSFSIWKITPTSASIQSLPEHVWYGALHQNGFGSLRDVARNLVSSVGKPLTPTNINKVLKQLESGKLHPTNQRRATQIVIPARPFIMFQEEDVEAIQEIFIAWMERRVSEVGRDWNQL